MVIAIEKNKFNYDIKEIISTIKLHNSDNITNILENLGTAFYNYAMYSEAVKCFDQYLSYCKTPANPTALRIILKLKIAFGANFVANDAFLNQLDTSIIDIEKIKNEFAEDTRLSNMLKKLKITDGQTSLQQEVDPIISNYPKVANVITITPENVDRLLKDLATSRAQAGAKRLAPDTPCPGDTTAMKRPHLEISSNDIANNIQLEGAQYSALIGEETIYTCMSEGSML